LTLLHNEPPQKIILWFFEEARFEIFIKKKPKTGFFLRSLFWCPSFFGTTPIHLELGRETEKGERYCRGSLTGEHSGAGK
jgi:hypothetical protein